MATRARDGILYSAGETIWPSIHIPPRPTHNPPECTTSALGQEWLASIRYTIYTSLASSLAVVVVVASNSLYGCFAVCFWCSSCCSFASDLLRLAHMRKHSQKQTWKRGSVILCDWARTHMPEIICAFRQPLCLFGWTSPARYSLNIKVNPSVSHAMERVCASRDRLACTLGEFWSNLWVQRHCIWVCVYIKSRIAR